MTSKSKIAAILIVLAIIVLTWTKRGDYLSDQNEDAPYESVLERGHTDGSPSGDENKTAIQPSSSTLKNSNEMATSELYGSEDELVKSALTKANVNSRDKEGRTSLMIVSFKRNLEATRALIAAGADLNLVDSSGQDALMSAIDGGSKEVALALINAGSKVDHMDHSGQSTLNYAVSLGDSELIDVIIKGGGDPNYLANKAGYTMLMNVAHEGLLEPMRSLLVAGAKVDSVDDEGNSVLHHGVLSGNNDVVELLLTSGAPKNIKNNKGETPLDLAKKLDLPNIVAMLQEP